MFALLDFGLKESTVCDLHTAECQVDFSEMIHKEPDKLYRYMTSLADDI